MAAVAMGVTGLLASCSAAPSEAVPAAPPSSTTSSPAPTTSAPASSTTVPAPPPPSTAPPAAVPTRAAAGCADPAFTTSKADDGWSDGDYYVQNNMWNASDYDVSQTLTACSYRDWAVTATAEDSGDGAVKTYPNVHKDYHDWETDKEPPLSAYPTLKSTFAATSPHTGVYNVAYDIWLNGVPGDREIMIWTDNNGQSPAGDRVATALPFSGTTWDLYATDDNEYLAFIPAERLTSGSLDLRAFLDHLIDGGRVPANSTLGQICFGVEIVSTGGKPATFQVTDFSVTD